MKWLSRLRQDVRRGWADPAPDEDDGPLLSSTFLRQVEALSLGVGRHSTTGPAGEHASLRKAHSIEFADYRRYRPGDDFRLIDWNVYARLGQLTLRLTEATEATTVHLLLDCSASMAFGVPSKFRTMQRLAAALGCLALARYDSVALGILRGDTGQVLPRLTGRNETGRFLSVLDQLSPRGTSNLGTATRMYCSVPRRGVGVLISDLLVPSGVAEAVASLRQAGLEPAVLQILAPDEARPRLEGPLSLVDCETGVALNTSITGAALSLYSERFAAWSAEIESICAAQRAMFVRMFTDQSLEDMLFTSLRGRIVR